MKKYITYLLFSLLVTFGATAKELNAKFKIIPQPQQIEVYGNEALTWSQVDYIITNSSTMPVLGEMLNNLPRSTQPLSKGIKLVLTDENVPESPEGYVLDVTRNGVTIKARTDAGLFYGCATFEQLMQDSKDFNLPIPQLCITDWPDITFRAVHFDTKHHLDRIEYYYRMIDKLSSYKINAIIWEIEDKLQYTRRPECTSPNAISKQEMQAICRYAKERHIEINPLVQGLGHAGFILKHHWELRENPDSDWEFCPSDPRTYELQFDLYKDALEAMPYGKYLHIGGDEITAIGIDERCKKTGKTPFELQMIWLKKVCDFAKANGRTPIFWDDMPLKYANLWWVLHGGLTDEQVEKEWKTDKLDEAVSLFPKDCIYMRWHYDDPTILPHRKVLDWYKHKDLKVMAATAASDGGSPFMPRYESKVPNIKNFSRLVVENNLVGILATAWDDGSPHWETIIRGFIAQGEYGWHPNGRSVVEFKQAHAQREFGLIRNELSFLDELEQSAFFFDKALIESGRRNPAWQVIDYTLIDMPDKSKHGTWSEKYRSKLDSAKIEQQRFAKISQEIESAKQHALRNRYTLEIYEQNNFLFNYPAQLLLALEKYDMASSNLERETACREIKEVCDDFHIMRSKLEAVYSKTRFMQNPEGYISDMNHHHHLSALSNGSDWLYLYEIPTIKRVKKWLE